MGFLPSSLPWDQLETWVPVALPKYIQILNYKLGLLLVLLRLLAVFFVLWILVSQKIWVTQVVTTDATSFWSGAGTDYPARQGKDLKSAAFCDRANHLNYDYMYDEAGTYKYVNSSCTNLPPNDRWVKGEQEIYLPTFFQDTMIEFRAVVPSVDSDNGGYVCESSCEALTGCRNGGFFHWSEELNEEGNCICKCETVRNRFVTGVESMTVSFEHSISGGVDSFSSSIDSHQLKTVVRNPDTKEELFSFEPGRVVQMSVLKLLDLANVKLDDRYDKTLSNKLKVPGVQDFPVYRMTGMELEIRQVYEGPTKEDPEHVSDHDGPICYIEVRLRPAWASRPRTDFAEPVDISTGEGRYRYRYNYGIRISFKSTGSFAYFDPFRLFTWFGTTLVYLSLPSLFMTLLAQYALGNLSTVYKQMTLQPLKLTTIFKGMVTRALVAGHTFDQMLSSETDGKHSSSSKTQFHSFGESPETKTPKTHLSESGTRVDIDHDKPILPSAVVDEKMRAIFESHIHHAPSTPSSQDAPVASVSLDHHELQNIRRIVCGETHDDRSGVVGITLEDFVENSINNDPGTLEDLARFFDQDRKRSLMERLFNSERAQGYVQRTRSGSLSNSGRKDLDDRV